MGPLVVLRVQDSLLHDIVGTGIPTGQCGVRGQEGYTGGWSLYGIRYYVVSLIIN